VGNGTSHDRWVIMSHLIDERWVTMRGGAMFFLMGTVALYRGCSTGLR